MFCTYVYLSEATVNAMIGLMTVCLFVCALNVGISYGGMFYWRRRIINDLRKMPPEQRADWINRFEREGKISGDLLRRLRREFDK